MKSLIELQKRLLPDLLSIIQKRFHILQYIGAMEPVGRRSLSRYRWINGKSFKK